MKGINGETRICGLLANPVEHTLSPLIHNTLSKKMGINMAYVPFKPEKEGLKQAVKGAYELNILGMNVSVPYKQQIIESLLEMDSMAESIGAVNTLVRIDGGYKGYNTDIMGLKRAMDIEGVTIKNKQVVLLGAGGVARAIAHLCVKEGAEKIWVLNRTFSNAEMLAGQINTCYHINCAEPLPLTDYRALPKERYLVIQNTNVGMHPNINQAVIEDSAFYQMVETAYDIIYTPFTTKFMEYATTYGAKAFNGLRMLVYQGICAYELWNQVRVPEETAKEIYDILKKELGI
ncbi:MAG: shikimate dehydrogenase [Lachnospiraceae bacterium]|nr:shikimate dehydrogenase [Lachnospiraceae bacterium]